MFELPRRISLAEQTATSIRKAIAGGTWTGTLPSERRLCGLFNVSRPTVRSALHMLARDGWLDIREGRSNRISPSAPAPDASPTHLVVLVTHLPVGRWSQAIYEAFADIRTRLAVDGFVTEVLVCDGPTLNVQQRRIDSFLKQNRVLCCVLLSLRYELQQWFSEHAVPALVIGSCAPNIRMPNFEVDLRAASRHAAGLFLRLGHRRLAVIVPDSRRGGDMETEQGFLETVSRFSRGDNARAIVVRHHAASSNLIARLDELFSRGHAPTALLVAEPHHAITTMLCLQRRGLRVPHDVSVACRDADPLFRLTFPRVTHYEFEGEAYAHALARMMMKLVREGRLARKSRLIGMRYVEGDTVARCPQSPEAAINGSASPAQSR